MAAPRLLCGRSRRGAPTPQATPGNGAVAPLRKRAAPITLPARIAFDLDQLPHTKELADAEFWTATRLETTSFLRGV